MMSAQMKTLAILTAHAGKVVELRQLLDAMLMPSRAEPGNLRYDLWQDRDDPARFVLDELYIDADAVAAHRASAHFQTYAAKIADLAQRIAIPLAPVAVA